MVPRARRDGDSHAARRRLRSRRRTDAYVGAGDIGTGTNASARSDRYANHCSTHIA